MYPGIITLVAFFCQRKNNYILDFSENLQTPRECTVADLNLGFKCLSGDICFQSCTLSRVIAYFGFFIAAICKDRLN